MESGPIHLFWETVKEQTVARLRSETPPGHYLGSVLVDNKTKRDASDGITRYDVVDGQQRLTTIQIALLALVKVAADHRCNNEINAEVKKYAFFSEPVTGFTEGDIRLNPTNFDRKQFQEVLSDVFDIRACGGKSSVSRENANKSKIVSTFDFFKKHYAFLVEKQQDHEPSKILRAILSALTEGFDIVRIVLRETDKAQRVFESLNNYAKPLTTFDLIRNNVFYRAAGVAGNKDVQLFNTDEWQQLECPYWEGKADNRKIGWSTHIEAYVARMLAAERMFASPKDLRFDRNSIFKTYQKFAGRHSSIEEEIGALVRYADVYQYLDGHVNRPPAAADVDFGVFRYDVWKNRDFYPVLFVIADGNANNEEKQRMIQLLESYVIRRSVCGLSSRNYNKQALTICEALGGECSYESLSGALKSGDKKTVLFPDDATVKEACSRNKFYGSVFDRYVFEEIEKSMYDVGMESVVAKQSELTIDHILPQGWEANPEWVSIVLDKAGTQNDTVVLTVNSHLHTIGNLTLMSRHNNSAKSNHSFEEVKGLLAKNKLSLNSDLAKEESWNVEKIAARSKELADLICRIWPYDIA